MKKRVFFLGLFGLGIFLLIQVIMPLISYKLWEIGLNNQNKPLASAAPINTPILGVSIKNSGNFPAIISGNKRSTALPYAEFNLTVPSIKLQKVRVVVETNDFENNLAHLPGVALPGEKGNVFITGHSSLASLYRANNFKAIFANLPQVKEDDQILVEAGGQVFEYRVVNLKVIDPKDVSVINPPDQTGRYLTLMTCVPPGLYLKRLIVLAELR